MRHSTAQARRSLPRTACAACVCFAVILCVVSPTSAAVRHPNRGPQTLWKAFPLNPTKEPLATVQAPSLTVAPKRPPVAPEVPDSSSDTALPLLAYTAFALLVLFALGLVALRVHARVSRRSVVLSHVVVGFWDQGVRPRLIPDIEARVRGRRSRTHLVIASGGRSLRARMSSTRWALRRRMWAVRRRARDLRRRRFRIPSPIGIVGRARHVLRREEVRAAMIGVGGAVVLAYLIERTLS
jgi:hypothetical protein